MVPKFHHLQRENHYHCPKRTLLVESAIRCLPLLRKIWVGGKDGESNNIGGNMRVDK